MRANLRRTWTQRYAGGVLLLCTLPVVMGITECEQSTPTPVCDTGCSPGEIVICGNVCAHPIPLNGACDIDPCTEDSLCEDGLTCMGTSTSATCVDMGGLLLSACNTAFYTPGQDMCANNLYCRDHAHCGLDTPLPDPGCAAPITVEGRFCDSNVADLPFCFPCAPGLECTSTSFGMACLRECTTDTDCACGEMGEQVGDCDNGFCRECVGLNESCDAYKQCCDGSVCEGFHSNGTRICCMKPDENQPCSDVKDCCGASPQVVCAPGAEGDVCMTCRDNGDACTDDKQCCNGTCGEDGKCKGDCVDDEPCGPTGELGACSEGTTVCDENGDLDHCEPNEAALVEACDGIDGNCDGVDDDDAMDVVDLGDFCAVADYYDHLDPLVSQTCAPSTFSVSGVKRCMNGQMRCVAFEPLDFCAVPGPGCGRGIGESCTSNGECSPDLLCKSGSCQTDLMACGLWPGALGHCWLPSDVGTCTP